MGVCKKVSDCTSAILLLVTRESELVDYLHASIIPTV